MSDTKKTPSNVIKFPVQPKPEELTKEMRAKIREKLIRELDTFGC